MHENADRNSYRHFRVSQKLTESHIEQCRAKVTEVTGTFGNSVYKVVGPFAPDSRLACIQNESYANFEDGAVYVAAPAELVSGYGGLFVNPKSRFFWCRFQVTGEKITLTNWAVGMSVNQGTAFACRIPT